VQQQSRKSSPPDLFSITRRFYTMPTKASRIRRRAVGDTETCDDRVMWLPSLYSRDFLGLTAVDCGAADDPETEQRVTQAFRHALQKRKEWRARRREEQQTLSLEALRKRRNDEAAARIVARAEQEKAAA
jgi:hypothetical protein